ncbi:hypothetical protein H5P28_00150 [Ruficoccus amylovorans]|uniref:Uncharacterized protein n=1 Tax=Ruficoccus amylovorans TaxID=1804625 RepID=A0A842H8G4_9BACT|nr:hypothetical protein [Ruficoccus amylovorans]MBC2592662.1 hypothetical protein [Ruficoccus amylovorans]
MNGSQSTPPAEGTAYRRRGATLGGRVLARQHTRPVVQRYGLAHICELTLAAPGDWEVTDPASGKVIGHYTPSRFARLFEPINE